SSSHEPVDPDIGSCEEESPMSRPFFIRSQTKSYEWRFNQEFYEKIDEYLNSLGLDIIDIKEHQKDLASSKKLTVIKFLSTPQTHTLEAETPKSDQPNSTL